MAPRILAVIGPTASGKTELAVSLALRLGGEVVSADSMQIYRGMDIGTAKPTAAEMRGVPHHMLDVADPREDYSVARYVAEASACIGDILRRGKLPIVAGGTGLYIDSLIRGTSFAVRNPALREELRARAQQEGIGPLLEELRRVDPETAAKLHPHDEKRIIRALEVYRETGTPLSEHDRRTREQPPRYEAVFLGLDYADRADLRAAIARRVGRMMAAGLGDEVRALLAAGVPRSATALQAIGYKEIVAAFDRGEPAEAAQAEIALHTCQYAKRQLTWFRREAGVFWYRWSASPDFPRCVDAMLAHLAACGIRTAEETTEIHDRGYK